MLVSHPQGPLMEAAYLLGVLFQSPGLLVSQKGGRPTHTPSTLWPSVLVLPPHRPECSGHLIWHIPFPCPIPMTFSNMGLVFINVL